jgi:4-amino-4-deoxy-L-arabinose transferase-like glycosyltransferase
MKAGGTRPLLPFVLLLACGALVRIAAAFLHPPLNIDEARYLVTAHHLRHGIGYADWNGPEIDILPLHPILTAVLGKEARTLETRGRSVALIAGLLSLGAIVLLAFRFGGRVTALFALILAAFHPWLVRAAAVPQPETLYILFVALGLWLLWREGGALASAVAAGVCLAAAYLARPEGMLVGGVAVCSSIVLERSNPGRFARAAVAVAVMALLTAPYLVWLRQQVGYWTLTGKASEVFFIGQAMDENDGEPPSAELVGRLQEEGRDGVTAYSLAHPGAVLHRIGRLLAILFLWIIPRGVGPLGIAGLCALAILRPPGASRALLAALPAAVLPLMAFSHPEQRVVASTLPFLFIAAGAGLAAAFERLPAEKPRRWNLACLGIAVLLLVGWLPGAARFAVSGTDLFVDAPKWAARVAMDHEPDVMRIATNNPVIAFHLAAPDILGSPGAFRPLPYDLDCEGLTRELRTRGATIAILDRPEDLDAVPSRSCATERLAVRHDPLERRVITIDRLAPATGRVQPAGSSDRLSRLSRGSSQRRPASGGENGSPPRTLNQVMLPIVSAAWKVASAPTVRRRAAASARGPGNPGRDVESCSTRNPPGSRCGDQAATSARTASWE